MYNDDTTIVLRKPRDRRRINYYWWVEDIDTEHIYLKADTYCVTRHNVRYVCITYVEWERREDVVSLIIDIIRHYKGYAHVIDIPAETYYSVPELEQFGFFEAWGVEDTFSARIPSAKADGKKQKGLLDTLLHIICH